MRWCALPTWASISAFHKESENPVSRIRISLLLLAALALIIVGCSPSPKSQATEFIKYLPEEIGEWKLDEQVELFNSTVTSLGHITLIYEGPDDALADIVVEAHPTVDAADVAFTSRERELRMRGLIFETDRAPQQVTAQVAPALDGRAWYVLMQEQAIVVEINVLGADPDTVIEQDALADLLLFVRNAYSKTMDE
jgi:hypothetical protein